MTDGAPAASLAEEKKQNKFVTLAVAEQLTNYSSAYIERLCRDRYIGSAGGVEGEILPNIADLLSILNITLPPSVNISYVERSAIETEVLTSDFLNRVDAASQNAAVGNLPADERIGSVIPPQPLKRGVLPFQFVQGEVADPLVARKDREISPSVVGAVPDVQAAKGTEVTEIPPAPPVHQSSDKDETPVLRPLPEHWPIKTSKDVSAHYDDAPLLPPLTEKKQMAPKAGVDVTEPVNGTAAVLRDEMVALHQPAPLLVEEQHALDIPKEEHIDAPMPNQVTLPVMSTLAPVSDVAIEIPEQHELAAEVPQDIITEEDHALSAPLQEEIMLPPNMDLIPVPSGGIAEQDAIQMNTLEREVGETAESGEMTSSVEHEQNTSPAMEAMNAEESVVDGGQISAEAATGSDQAEDVRSDATAQEPSSPSRAVVGSPEVIFNPAPPPVDPDISNRIFSEATQSMKSVTALSAEEAVQQSSFESEPIVAVPHYSVAQLTQSMHPLALPPRVVPFATTLPAAYPQVAAVFTQPHARASEWLPWMRTSHFSRNAVSANARVDVHPAYAQHYDRPKESRADEILDVKARPQPEEAVAAAQKVYVSVVKKPTAPVAIPVERHQHQDVVGDLIDKARADAQKSISAQASSQGAQKQTVRNIPKAEDSWDEVLAPETIRQPAQVVQVKSAPQKTAEELIREVSPEIKDSWDASFLSGLSAAS